MAAEPLGEGWLEAVASQLENVVVPGAADGVMQVSVSGSPSGAASFHAVVADGHLSVASGPNRGADVVLSWTFADFVQAWQGGLSLESAYMSGRVKVEGDQVLLFDGWRPLLQSEELRAALATLR